MAGYSWQHNYVKYNQTEYYNNDRSKVYLQKPTDRREYYLLSFFGNDVENGCRHNHGLGRIVHQNHDVAFQDSRRGRIRPLGEFEFREGIEPFPLIDALSRNRPTGKREDHIGMETESIMQMQ